MANEVYEVETWADLKAKLEAGGNNYTVKLMNDLDLNLTNPEGDTVTIGNQTDTTSLITLDLNGHSIRNLRTKTTNTVPIFQFPQSGGGDRDFKIKNGDFINLICAGASFFKVTGTNQTRTLYLENVRIVGFRTGNAFLYLYSNTVTIKLNCTSCYFDFPWYGANSTDYTYVGLTPYTQDAILNNCPIANYCWFHETHGGWSVPSPSGESNPAFTSFRQFRLNGCYADGTVRLNMTQNGISLYYYVYAMLYYYGINYLAPTPNVIDITWETNTPSSINYRSFYTSRGNFLFRKPSQFGSWSAVTDQSALPVPIFATAEEMMNAEWLRSKGFPVIEPTT